MAAFQLHNRPPPPSALPCRQSIVMLLLVCLLLLSCTQPISCICSGSEQYPSYPYYNTVSGAFDQLPGYLTNNSTFTTDLEWVDCRGLGSYIKTNYPAFDLSQEGWFFVGPLSSPSFSVVFTMSIYQQKNLQMDKAANNGASLVFAVNTVPPYDGTFTPPNGQVLGPSNSKPSSSSNHIAGGHLISAEIGTANGSSFSLLYPDYPTRDDIIWAQISIDPPPGNSSVAAAAAAAAPAPAPSSRKYRVWIDYNDISNHMSVYVDATATATDEDAPKPGNAIASKNLSATATNGEDHVMLGLFSSMGQLLQVHTWNSTVVDTVTYGYPEPEAYSTTQKTTVIVSSVLGSVAATAIMTALVFLYLNSKYRMWQKEQDELTKIMQGIPGVPAHVDFTEIRKATSNFHETTKLGKGGFGAVYRCKLPPAVARNRRTRQGAMDVAVKKFTRQVEDHRSSDFIAEVSIINRLRHKNIVPLVGWSYNKGEALLVYEYMTNGSLDQHLFFQKGCSAQQQQADRDMSSLRQWHTRYGIARDIATGLHYVHHEHEPMVLHRDIKASNVMLDSDFRARLGDFGIACTVAGNRSSVTGIAGTWGYIAPDYAMSYKATRQTDIYAFGVLVLEIVTGKKNGDMPPDPGYNDEQHITDWIWRLHGEGKLLDAVDASVLVAAGCGGDRRQPQDVDDGVVADEARRLLLLGLACTDPNPMDRPSMAQVLQVITKVMPPPVVPPQKPAFVWPPRDWRSRNSVYSTAGSDWDRYGSSASTSQQVQLISMEQPSTLEDTYASHTTPSN